MDILFGFLVEFSQVAQGINSHVRSRELKPHATFFFLHKLRGGLNCPLSRSGFSRRYTAVLWLQHVYV